VPDIWGNAMTAGVTQPAPVGVQQCRWNPQTNTGEKAWLNHEVDHTDGMEPVISAKSGMVYLANKPDGEDESVGLDWRTGAVEARGPFADDSRQWNAYGGITGLLEDGDLLIGGVFAMKRVNVGDGGH
jgi:hypothetical protein